VNDAALQITVSQIASQFLLKKNSAIRRAFTTQPIDQQGHLDMNQSNKLFHSESSRFTIWRCTSCDTRASQIMVFRDMFVHLKNDISISICRAIYIRQDKSRDIQYNCSRQHKIFMINIITIHFLKCYINILYFS